MTIRVPLQMMETIEELARLERRSRSCASLAILARGLDAMTPELFNEFVKRTA